jgi:DNA polymerase-1
MARKLLLVDASNSIYRAFFALPPLATSAGVPTNATLGFTTMLQKLLRETTPDCVAVVWDSPGQTRRKALYAEYKATRDAAPGDLRAQIPWIRKIVDAYAIATVECAGEEADDVIATLTRAAERAGFTVEIASTDKDLFQLASPSVHVLDTMRDRRYGPAEVEGRFGVTPAQMLDLRALIGDSSDNIPGVKGIGEKGAAELLKTHGSLDAMLANPDAIAQKRPREALRAGAESARLSRELSRLREDLPVGVDLESLAVRAPDVPRLAELFRELELRRLLEQLGEAATAPRPSAPAEPVEIATARSAAEQAELAKRLGPADPLALELALEPPEPMRAELVSLALSDACSRAPTARGWAAT